MAKFDLTHARHDPAHCLAPGLFRSLKRGERKTSKLDVTYEFGQGQKIEFSGPEPLGADDLRILQGLVALAGPSGLVLSSEPESIAGTQLRMFMEPKWDAIQQNAMVVRGSYRLLAREVGYANVDDTRPIRDSLERLWKVSIIAYSKGKRRGFRLLSEYASDDASGKLFVALNPMITQAVTGGGQFTHINLMEVRTLKSDSARLMHQRLCGWIDPGKSRRIELDTLCSYIWPDAAKPAAMRKRRQRAKSSLLEFVAIGWSLYEYTPARFEIGRPAHVNSHTPHVNCPISPR